AAATCGTIGLDAAATALWYLRWASRPAPALRSRSASCSSSWFWTFRPISPLATSPPGERLHVALHHDVGTANLLPSRGAQFVLFALPHLTPGADEDLRGVGAAVPTLALVPLVGVGAALPAGLGLPQVPRHRLGPVVGRPGQEFRVRDLVVRADGQLER